MRVTLREGVRGGDRAGGRLRGGENPTCTPACERCRVTNDDEPTITLERWTGPWPDGDPDANFKCDVALYANVDPLRTITNLADNVGVPAGAICRYVLARWATEGSGGLLELGPHMVERLWSVCDRAEQDGTDAARLDAYAQLRQMLTWLRLPLHDRAGYDDGT